MTNSAISPLTSPLNRHSGLDPESSLYTSASTSHRKRVFLIFISYTLFILLTTLGFTQGKNFGLWLMWENFGEPRDLYPVLFAYVMLLFAFLFSIGGILITFILMHQVGRRLKIAVGKPTFYGFLLYLLTLLILILYYNQTH